MKEIKCQLKHVRKLVDETIDLLRLTEPLRASLLILSQGTV